MPALEASSLRSHCPGSEVFKDSTSNCRVIFCLDGGNRVALRAFVDVGWNDIYEYR